MVQVLKATVRESIVRSAARCFAERGYPGTSVAQVARAAGTAPGNVYRYFASKEELLEAVVPAGLLARHDALLDARVDALPLGGAAAAGTARATPDQAVTASELLTFWLTHRFAVAFLLDAADGSVHAHYPQTFVDRLVGHAVRRLGDADPFVHDTLHLVFDGTRRALARILLTAEDDTHARALVTAFWSYQLPGLDGLLTHLAARRT